jgi:hypothetical protein
MSGPPYGCKQRAFCSRALRSLLMARDAASCSRTASAAPAKSAAATGTGAALLLQQLLSLLGKGSQLCARRQVVVCSVHCSTA